MIAITRFRPSSTEISYIFAFYSSTIETPIQPCDGHDSGHECPLASHAVGDH